MRLALVGALLWVAVWAGSASAVVPVPLVLGLSVSGHMGAMAAVEMSDSSSAQLAGQQVLAVTLRPVDPSGAEAAGVRLPTTSNSGAAITAPSAPATAAKGGAVTVGSYDGTPGLGWRACSAYPSCGVIYMTYGECRFGFVGVCVPVKNTNGTYAPILGASGLPVGFGVPGQALPAGLQDAAGTCGAGYAPSGDECVLVDSRAAASDGFRDWLRAGPSVSPASSADVDATKIPVQVGTTSSSNDTIRTSGFDSGGRPTAISIQSTADGGSVVTKDTQHQDLAGATYVNHTVMNIGPDGTVNSVNSSNNAGTVTVDGNGGGTASTGQSVTPNGDSANCGGAGQPECGQGGSCGGPNQPKCAIDDSGFLGANAGAQSAVDAHNAYATGRLDAVEGAKSAPAYSNWMPSLMPGSATACVPLTWHASISHGPMAGFASDVSYDMCSWFEWVRQFLGWLFFVVTAVYIYRSFTHSNKATA